MTTYIVHIFREMRLSFTDIKADTPEAAATIAGDKPTSDADDIEDCGGENLSALVDVAGDDDYSQSIMIDFEGERTRKASAALLAACRLVVGRWERGDLAEAARACGDAIARAETDAVFSPSSADQMSRFEIERDPKLSPDRICVRVDGLFGVAIVRTPEGIVIDVYPNDWIDPIDTMTVWDDQVVATHEAAE